MGAQWLHAAVLAGLVLAPAGATARVLLEDRGTQVTMPEAMQCGQPVRVDITASRDDLFRGDSGQLQGLVDAARAMLGFECRQIPEIRVTGLVQGYRDARYQGVVSAATDWRLPSSPGYAGAAPAPAPPVYAPAPAPVYAPATAPAPVAARYSVRDITTGMSVDAALDQARRSFDGEPRYDSRKREIAVVRGGCDVSVGARPRPGWVCMKALFTEGRNPLSYRVSYAQVVDQNQGEAIASQLRERFGTPMVDEQQRGASWLAGGAPDRRLAWGGLTKGKDGESRHELEAAIRVDSDVTVLSLDLLDASLSASAPRVKAQF